MSVKSDYRLAFSSSSGPSIESPPKLLQEAVETVLRMHDVASAKISFVFVGDDEMADLNEKHLGHQGPTDVLTFDLRDDGSPGGAVEGEIVVSVDTAAREAAARGHSRDAELALYAVHGVLHLLGYDDGTKEQAARMHEVEDRVFTALGLAPVFGAVEKS
jgi:probable rRNA maturation factor